MNPVYSGSRKVSNVMQGINTESESTMEDVARMSAFEALIEENVMPAFVSL